MHTIQSANVFENFEISIATKAERNRSEMNNTRIHSIMFHLKIQKKFTEPEER